MATSSITKNFVISTDEQLEKFIDAFEDSKKNRPKERVCAPAKLLSGEEFIQFMKERNAMHID